LRAIKTLAEYDTLTVRMLYYRLVSIFDYPNDRRFYKRLQYSLKTLRKLLPELNQKFEDVTRRVSRPRAPRPPIELWVEKSSLEFFLKRLADRYHVPTLSERGFGSITMFVKAANREKRRGVRKILFVSDHDPSGLMINRVTGREMPVPVERVALTMGQIRRYRLPSIRVKRSDSRAKKYIEEFGDNAWEVEGLPPRALLRNVEARIRMSIPPRTLARIQAERRVEETVAPLEKELVESFRRRALGMIRTGLAKPEIIRRLRRIFHF